MNRPPLNSDRRETKSIQEWATIAALVINLAGIIWVTAQQNSRTDVVLTQVQAFQASQNLILNSLIDKVNKNTINIAVIGAKTGKEVP